jgi:hypothetical protein
MDRGVRRWRNAHVKARRLRFYYEYWGLPQPWLYNGEWQPPLRFERGWYVRPWQVNGRWLFSTPGAWVREMMTRPARAEQQLALRRVQQHWRAPGLPVWDSWFGDDVLEDIATRRWPDYRRPHIYYW